MHYEVPHFINGQLERPEGRELKIYNPAAGESCGHLTVADESLVNKAVAAATLAFPAWSKTPIPHRAKRLFQFKALLDANKEVLTQLLTQEHGKTWDEARGSIQRGIDVVDYTCGIANHLKGEFAEEVAAGIDCYSIRQALGVCVGITPFNFPAMIPLWMFPLAIACGNTFVLKPSEKDPSCSIKLVELAKEAGIPDGVVNVVQGDSETVKTLLHHPDVKAVSFVGSSTVAESVYQTATSLNKRVQAFGGAKNHCVLMPDANLDQVVKLLLDAAFGSAGERCMAISVVIAVGDEIADRFVDAIAPQVKNLCLSIGSDKNVNMGPLITPEHYQKVLSYIELGKQEGAKLLVDGTNCKSQSYPQGFFMGGSLFDQVKPHMRIYKEEIFGPVLGVMRVPDFETALQLINEHEYGNGTAIFTQDGYIARQFVENVQVGMVGVNVPIPVPVAYQSFGGWKRSIFSDIGMYGSEGIRFYTKLKTVTARWFPRT